MRFVAYVIMLFSFSVILYYMGYGPIITIFEEKGAAPLSISCPAGNPFCTDTTVVIGAMIFIILSAGILVTLVSGFSSFYIVPLLLLIAVLNFVIFPFNFIMSAPTELAVPVMVFMNILTVLAVLNFVRGGA